MISKQRLVALHRWMALAAGLVLAAIGITGSTLVYKAEIESRAHPERIVGAASPRYEAVLSTARAVAPAAERYTIDIVGGHAFRVDARGPGFRRMHVDPRDGRLISQGGRTDDWIDLVERLHTHMLAGEPGEYAVAAVGAILLLLAVTGLVQGWPRRWASAVRIRLHAPSPWLAFDLHRVIGLAAVVFLVVNAATGIVMVFSAPVARSISALAGSEWPADTVVPAAQAGAPRASLDDVVRSAQRAFPGGRPSRIVVKRGEAPVSVRMHAPGDNHPVGLGSVDVNPHDASVIRVAPLASLSAGQRMFDWLFPLHVGRLLGEPHRILQVAVGLTPSLLLASGLVVWARRRKARYKAKEK